MKILQIFGAVVAVHLLAFIFIFASPGCQSGPRNIPTPDATMPTGATAPAPVTFNVATPQPVDLSAPSSVGYNPASPATHAAPTRPGSAAAAAITPPRPVAEVTSTSTYTVARGDSLWTIAKRNGMSVSELARLNNLSAGVTLRPGQKLMIPVKGPAPAASAASDAPRNLGTLTQQLKAPVNAEGTTHVVVAGENLGVIARKYGVTVGAIATANNLDGPTIRAGQKLIIPGAKTVAVKGGTTPAPKSAPATTPAETPADTPPPASPRFELTPPPPGQDLDAGLKDAGTEVPTIKVEEQPKS